MNEETVETVEKSSLKVNWTSIVTNVIHKCQSFGFWVLILIAAGFYLGIGYVKLEVKSKTKDTILLGSFIYDGQVYDVKKRIQ